MCLYIQNKTEKRVLLRQKYIKKGYFFLEICFLGCGIRIWNPFLGVGIGNPIFFTIFCLFLIKNDNGGPVGNRGFQGGRDKPNIKQIVKKKSVKKSQKSAKSEKKSEK